MNKRKIFLAIVSFVVIIGINLLALLPNTAKADWYCDGYHWKKCLTGRMVIRCDCTGGAICYASWQDLCPDPT